MSVIYTLSDPRDGTVRYVGQTRNPKRRNYSHRCPSHTGNMGKRAWTVELRAIGLAPVFAIIEECDTADRAAAEKKWIAHYRALGADLLNLTSGGQSPPPFTEETRAKMREAAKHRTWPPISEEHRAALLAGRAKVRLSKEHYERLGELNRKRMTGVKLGPVSEEVRVRMWLAANARCLKKGKDFVKLVNTDDPNATPLYVVPERVWNELMLRAQTKVAA
jgi:hypothetical protein